MDGALLLVLLIGLMYVVLVLPRRRQMNRQRALLSSLAVGDDVVTIGGLHGTITDLDTGVVTLSVSPGVEVRFAREAVARKVEPSMDPGLGDADGNEADDGFAGGTDEGEPGGDTGR